MAHLLILYNHSLYEEFYTLHYQAIWQALVCQRVRGNNLSVDQIKVLYQDSTSKVMHVLLLMWHRIRIVFYVKSILK